jgi:DNA-binding transcriptional regulator YiaG
MSSKQYCGSRGITMERRKITFVYEGLGFPVKLIDTPMKKVFGEWVIDIDMNALQMFVFKSLIHKPYPLTGKEMRFMRKFMGMSTMEFGENLGVSHAAVVKWEKEQAKVGPIQVKLYAKLWLCERHELKGPTQWEGPAKREASAESSRRLQIAKQNRPHRRAGRRAR